MPTDFVLAAIKIKIINLKNNNNNNMTTTFGAVTQQMIQGRRT